MAGETGDPVNALIVRVTRRLAVAGLGGGLISFAIGRGWPVLAGKKPSHHKAGGSGGQKKHHPNHGGKKNGGASDNGDGKHKGAKKHKGDNSQKDHQKTEGHGSGGANNSRHKDNGTHKNAGKSGSKHDASNKDVHADIVGGAGVPAAKYPFQVALLDKRNGEKGFTKQFCGGSLIDAQHVLTAAHCVASRNGDGPKNVRVLIGVTELNSKQGQTRQIATITTHPGYDGKSGDNDVAVLRLDSPVDTSQFPPITPAGPGDKGMETPGTILTVAGWGSMHQHIAGKKNRNKPPKYSHVLREVQIPVIPDDECVSDYGEKGGGSVNPQVMLCAGQPGQDSCWGDSGGPLFVASQGGYIQVGIVSWGGGCAAPDSPGVYTRVTAISDFIQSATSS